MNNTPIGCLPSRAMRRGLDLACAALMSTSPVTELAYRENGILATAP